MKKLDCSEEQAKEFLIYVSKQIGIVQIALSEIASSRRTFEEKQKIIDFLLNYIVEEDAVIFVSSKLGSGRIDTFSVKQYLYHLSRLSQNYKYESVNLFFDPNYLRLLGLERLPEGDYHEMHIIVKQYFRGGFHKYGTAYRDLTLKNFMCTIREIRKAEYELKLKSIQVRETLDVTEQKLAQAKKDFEQYKRDFMKYHSN
ncbi:MAG: hypothetical protein J5I94_13985 [Phaeodactylibacter sp.]|nr:hypothetical protein [Phaeodactylibacter sp.]